MSMLIADEITYYSQGDEEAFFTWLKGIACVSDVQGKGRHLHITIDDARVGPAELRELIGIFHRYKIQKKQLARFVSEENKSWFRDNKNAYWHEDVFG
jgi:hypothetical protein